jgi:hypothetical protein
MKFIIEGRYSGKIFIFFCYFLFFIHLKVLSEREINLGELFQATSKVFIEGIRCIKSTGGIFDTKNNNSLKKFFELYSNETDLKKNIQNILDSKQQNQFKLKEDTKNKSDLAGDMWDCRENFISLLKKNTSWRAIYWHRLAPYLLIGLLGGMVIVKHPLTKEQQSKGLKIVGGLLMADFLWLWFRRAQLESFIERIEKKEGK